MPTRRKNGRSFTTSPASGRAHGRLSQVAPAVRTRIDPGDPSERLGFALIERHLHNRGIRTEATPRAIKARIDRAREELASTPTGAEEARRITVGLTANGGALLRTVERSHVDLRPFAARAAVRFVALVREHAIESTAALVLLGSAAQWSALAEALRDLAFERGPAILSVSKSTTSGADHVSAQVGGFGDVLKLAQTASNSARLDLLTALDVEGQVRRSREGRPLVDGAEVERRMQAIAAERARRSAEPAEDQDEAEDDAGAPPSDRPAARPPGAHDAANDVPEAPRGRAAQVPDSPQPGLRRSRPPVLPPHIVPPPAMPSGLPSYMQPPTKGPPR